MRKLTILFISLLTFIWAEGVQLNLPGRFKVEGFSVFARCSDFDGAADPKVYNEKGHYAIFNFNQGNFTLKQIRESTRNRQVIITGKGTIKNGILSGTMKEISKSNYHDESLYYQSYGTSFWKLNGKINPKGYFCLEAEIVNEDSYMRSYNRNGNFWGKWFSQKNYRKGTIRAFVAALPVKQSSQASIPNRAEEPQPQQSSQQQPTPTINLPVDLSISATATKPQPQSQQQAEAKKEDPCKEFANDPAWQKYCANKKANEALRKEQEAQEDARIKDQERADAEDEKKIREWNKEQEAENAKLREDLAKEREAWRQREKETDKKQSEALAGDVAKMNARYRKKAKIEKMINTFGEDDETKSRLRKKVDTLSKDADLDKLNKIESAIKKIVYDSKQIKLQGEAEYQSAKADELEKSAQKAKAIRDTSLTVNKVLARLDPTGTGEKIVEWQENSYKAIEGYEKGGMGGAVDALIEKKASDLSNEWSDLTKETIETYKKYQIEGIKLKKDEVYYDKHGKRLKKVKKYQKIYNAKGEEVSFSYGRRIFGKVIEKLNGDYNSVQSTAGNVKDLGEGIVQGDINKVTNAALDLTEKDEETDDTTLPSRIDP